MHRSIKQLHAVLMASFSSVLLLLCGSAFAEQTFQIEPGTRYAAVLVNTPLPRESLILITPAGQLITPALVDPIGSWQAADGVQLIQLDSPAAGIWQLHNLGASDRIQLVLDPKLDVEPDFKFVTAGVAKEYRVSIVDGVSHQDATSLTAALTFRAEVFLDGDTATRALALRRRDDAVFMTVPPLPAGHYRLHLYAGGLGFESAIATALFANGPIDVKQTVGAGLTRVHLNLRDSGITGDAVASGQLAFRCDPMGWVTGLPSADGGIDLPVNTSSLHEGVPYRLQVALDGQGPDGRPWRRELEPIELAVNAGAHAEAASAHSQPNKHANAHAVANKGEHGAPSETPEAELPQWGLWSAVGAAHALLAFGVFTLLRRDSAPELTLQLETLLTAVERLTEGQSTTQAISHSNAAVASSAANASASEATVEPTLAPSIGPTPVQTLEPTTEQPTTPQPTTPQPTTPQPKMGAMRSQTGVAAADSPAESQVGTASGDAGSEPSTASEEGGDLEALAEKAEEEAASRRGKTVP